MSVKTLRWSKPLPYRQWVALAYVWGEDPITVSVEALTFDHARALLRVSAAELLESAPERVYLEGIGSVPRLPEGGAN